MHTVLVPEFSGFPCLIPAPTAGIIHIWPQLDVSHCISFSTILSTALFLSLCLCLTLLGFIYQVYTFFLLFKYGICWAVWCRSALLSWIGTVNTTKVNWIDTVKHEWMNWRALHTSFYYLRSLGGDIGPQTHGNGFTLRGNPVLVSCSHTSCRVFITALNLIWKEHRFVFFMLNSKLQFN